MGGTSRFPHEPPSLSAILVVLTGAGSEAVPAGSIVCLSLVSLPPGQAGLRRHLARSPSTLQCRAPGGAYRPLRGGGLLGADRREQDRRPPLVAPEGARRDVRRRGG